MSSKPAPQPSLPADPCRVRLPTGGELDDFHHQGFVILRGLVHAECVAALREEVLTVVRARNLDNLFLGQSHEYLADGLLNRWLHGGHLKRLVEAFLGGPSRLYLPFTAVKGPRQGRFTFHQDNQYTPCRGPAQHIGLNVWCALVPMSPANGCLQVVPGSHRDGILPMTDSTDCPGHRTVTREPTVWHDCVMEAGDVVVFDRNNVHGSGANTTAAPRVAYAAQWHRDDTEAFLNGSWALLKDRPAYPQALHPVAALGTTAQKGE
jgi:phytanoyl-CoA hydroxylase